MTDNPNRTDEQAAEEAAQKYNDDWTSKQTIFYNGETRIRSSHFIPGFLAGVNHANEKLRAAEWLISSLKGHLKYMDQEVRDINPIDRVILQALDEIRAWESSRAERKDGR